MKRVKERFADYAVAGANVEQAIRMALEDAAAELRHGQARGSPLEDIASRLGLRELLGDGIHAVVRFAMTHWMNVPLSILPGSGGVRDVPDPDCMVAHLPSDRPPTRADYERAWELCAGSARP